ncbi:2-polyprenyl-6-methoxyphenol hydroxylase [Variovorax sp. WS11]|uniref:FAD-dependent oxidoreductase n=1 Tax=Variovorax sp. WS11 TaxID=1105204 RepID=UPI000D0CEFBC|nr:FAD-dependent oxidoreductase [Variovorax sp. WS11]NDZ17007.1 FAD-dependent oxidoreductase [Variovorax sp. WS11]PSL81383.1 2-polyprenyl-6-methoxyphenol hydroxylase [Variovorax sp. WS11]
MSNSMSAKTSVLVVGGGPVGLALAGDLGWRGIDCRLIERGDGRVSQPKMDMVGIRSMEFCRRWGIVPWVEAAGYNRDYPQDCAWVTDLNGYAFGREVFPSPRAEKPPVHSPQKRERCPQNFFDPVLKRFASSHPTVSLSYDTELVAFEDLGDAVEVQLRNTRTGDIEPFTADYVVGCDGGASTVRHALGIEMEGEPVLTHTTNVIFRCEGLEKLHKMEPAYRYIFIGPEGTWATLVAINGRDEWRFSLVGDSQKRTLTEEEARAAIVRAVGRPFAFEVLSMLPWVRRQLVAKEYGKGRVFIAGDAAHLTSPTGGFGMNTGILDVVNLSWKLAAMVEGWGGANLLPTYECEQFPVAVRNVGESSENLRRMLSPRVLRPDPAVFDTDAPDMEAARREYGQRYTEMMRREWFSIGVHLGYVYEGSPIVIPDGTPRPPLQVSSYTPTARPGSRAPHVWLEEGKSILDLFGRGFVLLRFGPNAPDAAPLEEAATAAGLPLQRIDIASEEAARLYERCLVLVRPDGQVAWRGDALPNDCFHLVDRIRGATNEPLPEKSNVAVLAEA